MAARCGVTRRRESTDFVLRSHAVVGAMDFLSEALPNGRCGGRNRNRPFVVTHAVPAALAILLHDWRIGKMRERGGFFRLTFLQCPWRPS